MKYGENTYLVEEVISFIKNHHFFIIRENVNSEINAINDFNKAVQCALESETWTDIREQEMTLVKRDLYQLPSYIEINNQLDDIDEIIDNALSDNVLDDYADAYNEIFSDFVNIAINRAINGKSLNFYEELFEAYKSGGWPCGWNGDYPRGKMVIYFPMDKSYSEELVGKD